jgi:Tfp pilus assembly protein PilF
MNSTQELLLSEMTQAKSYLDRLLHALMELSQGHTHPKVKEDCRALSQELEILVRDELLNEKFNEPQLLHRDTMKSMRKNVKNLTDVVESFIVLGADKGEMILSICKIINKIYEHCYKLHILTNNVAGLDVQPPRIGLLSVVENEAPKANRPAPIKQVGHFTVIEGGLEEDEELEDEDGNVIQPPKLYQLDIERVLSATTNNTSSLLGLEAKRDEKYDLYLALGHKAAFKKEHEAALEAFEKAKTFKETAEILTLIAWVHTLLGDNEKAKSLCLKAISVDPDYGPPYNDLGSILLNEGQLEESIKWFELAKSAPRYQNREYPFINAGRAYMMIKNYDKAMTEFEVALRISPDNEELRETVDKIKRTIEKKGSGFSVNFTETNHDFPTDEL